MTCWDRGRGHPRCMIRISRWIAGAAAFVTVGVGACSTDKPAACDSVAATQSSIDHTQDTNVSEDGLSSLKTQLNQLKLDLQKVAADAGAQFATEIQMV